MFKYRLINPKFNVFGDITKQLLNVRNIQDVKNFINPTDNEIENYLLLDNIELARDTYIKHIKLKSNIGIVVDCDVDGNTSAELIYSYTKRLNKDINIVTFIHNGKEHGLKDVVNDILKSNINLLIIPDAGTNDNNECKTLSENNIDIIILDHHLQSVKNNYAIIVNNQISKQIKDKSMTGVGVVYKFCKSIDDKLYIKQADDYMDLVALGMIADRCDLTNLQSRYYVLQGIKKMNNKDNLNPLIESLIDNLSYSLGKQITIDGVGFYIAPSLNAIIRCASYEDKCILFNSFHDKTSVIPTKVRGKGEVELSYQDYIYKVSLKCKEFQKKKCNEELDIISAQIDEFNMCDNNILVCKASDDLLNTLTGLVANKLADRYNRPTLLLRDKNKFCSGSGRGFDRSSISNFNKWCKDTKLFNFVEGHENAFGVSIKSNNMNLLFEKIYSIPYNNTYYYNIDGIFDESNLSKELILLIGNLNSIWGCGIEEPIFMIKDITINKNTISINGTNNDTLKFSYHNIEFIKFHCGLDESTEINNCGNNIKFSIIGKFKINEYKNIKKAQVDIIDMIYEKSNKSSNPFCM